MTALASTPTLALQRLQYQPPDLRAVRLLDRLLDEPLFPALGLVVAGIIALFVLNRAGKLPIGLVAIGASLLLGGGLVAADAFRTSPRERVISVSSALVDAVATGDRDATDALLDQEFTVSARRLPIPAARGILLAAVETFPAQASVEGHRVSEVRASITGGNTARSQVLVAIDGGVPRLSWWQMDWVLRGETWQLARLEPLWILGFDEL